MDARMGANINGPSLIRVPSWLSNAMGRYYLYFAHHKGETKFVLRTPTAWTAPGRLTRPVCFNYKTRFSMTMWPHRTST